MKKTWKLFIGEVSGHLKGVPLCISSQIAITIIASRQMKMAYIDFFMDTSL